VLDAPPSVEPLSKWNLASRSYYLVVCRLEPENHLLEIVKAFQRSASKRQLIVVGNHLTGTKYVEQLGAVRDERIRMIGTVYDQEELAALRYHCFAYLHGHSVGGTNPSLLEAMGCGNLILAHDNSFNRETLGDCGLFFKDSAELARVIDSAEKNEAELARWREAARKRARDVYSWEDIISRYAALLEQTVVDGKH
jgi:glycosyltransferase involved in cell wall biosynthesis